MSTISWHVEKKTFVPEKNYFKCENIKVWREESEEEMILYDQMMHYDSLGMTLSACLGLGGFFGAIIGGSLVANFVSLFWGICCVVFCLMVGISSIPVFRFLASKSDKYRVLWDKYRDDHDVWNTSPSVQEINVYNAEQERIAEVWRAEHPFEEHIRFCIKDPNSSVAIADAARYYAEHFLNKEISDEH